MTEPALTGTPAAASGSRPAPPLHASIFARLVALMLAMAASLLGLVAGFYFVIVLPSVHRAMDRMISQHTRVIAESAPDSAAARRLAEELGIEIRYEGPSGSWTTDDEVPTVERIMEARREGRRARLLPPGRAYYLARAPQGGHYLFVRRFGEHLQAAHDRFVLLMLALMVAVFATAYVVMRRALRPLKLLNEGVTRLGEGQLDVVVPNTSGDEFGVLTDAFNRMARSVQERVRARDQLLLDVSHELRSPLTRLKVALALLPDGAGKAGMAADVAEMEAMVTELLELERLRDGGMRTERRDLVPILREAAESFRDRPPGVRLEVVPAELPLDLDADRVRTVLRNLLENALKYSLPDSRPVEITATDRGDAVEVRVSDDGPGVPEGDRDRLFEPFFRLDRSRSKKTGGYGLGLSICKRIMEAHGGSIAVESRTGRGASFVLRFPKRATGSGTS